MKNGITLISLVITIIILLILAGVTINITIGENGILKHAQQAKINQQIAQYAENIELARSEVTIEKIGNFTIDDLIKKIQDNNINPQGAIIKVDEETAEVITKEGYVITVTLKETKYDRTETMESIPGTQEGDIIISEPIWDSVKGTANVTIRKGSNISDTLQIQYQVNGENQNKWITGESIEGLKHGDVINVRLWNTVVGGASTSKTIVDTILPENADIQLSGTSAITTQSLTATVTLRDNQSEINIGASKWIYTDSASELGTEPSSYEKTFEGTENTQIITLSSDLPGEYYLHILSIDNAGNAIETISDKVIVNKLVEGISLNKTSTSIEVGKTETLTATVMPENASDKSVTWTSSNENVATVSNGTITAVSKGTATITATANDGSGKNASCEVTTQLTINHLKAGNYVKYNAGSKGVILCRVLYEASSSYGLQIITDNCVETVNLVTSGSFDSALNQCNAAVSTLNGLAGAYCNTAYALEARCVGSNPSNKSAEPGMVTLSSGGYSMTTKANDNNYLTDWNAMTNANILSSNDNYWLASRDVSTTSSGVFVRVRAWRGGTAASAAGLVRIYASSGKQCDANVYKFGLRPCIKLNTNVIKIESGDGKTPDTAYVIGK